jgi:hypothetical protein
LNAKSDTGGELSGAAPKGAVDSIGGSGQKPTSGSGRKPGGGRNPRLLRAGVIAVAIVVALIAWLATRGGDSSSEPEPASTAAAAPPRIVTPAELREAAATLGQPIYWAGPMKGKELELRELGEGEGVQVLYLPEGTAAGEGPANALTIGSYPLSNPRSATEGFAERTGSSSRKASDGREVATSAESPTSVYFASPDNSVQVEVYDPSPQRAMSLALSGKVQPAG